MALTYEEMQEYVNAIDAIWQGSMRNNTIDNIDDNVVRIINTVLTEIRNGTKNMLIADGIFNIFYKPNIPWELALVLAVTTGGVRDWIGAILGDRQYRSVVNVIALNFKSPVQLALYGI